MNYRWLITPAVFGTLLFSSYVWAETTQQQLENKQTEVSDIEQQIADQQNEIERLKGEEQNLENELAILEAELDATELELQGAQAQLEQVELEIEFTEEQIVESGDQLDFSIEAYREQLAQSYIFSRTSSLEILFNSDSISDFSRNMKYLEVVDAENERLINSISALKNQLEEQRLGLETKRSEVQALQNEIEAKKNDLDEKRFVKEQLLATVQDRQITYEQLVQSSRASYAQLNNEIAALEEQIRQQEIERQRQLELERQRAQEQGLPEPAPPPAPSGGYVWPARGTITMSFWEEYPDWILRLYPGLPRNHTGLDIAAGSGTPIYSTQTGTVQLVRDYGYGYGRTIMVSHGGGVISLYAHLNGFNVSQGQVVAAGQQIGTMGSTGNSTGPHLHFEIRENGNYANPMSYLP